MEIAAPQVACEGQVLLAVFAVLAAGCAGAHPDYSSSAPPSLSDVQIAGQGAAPTDAFCADFRLTAAQAERYFERARAIDSVTLHDRFDYLPCWVRGNAKSQGALVAWEIRAGGTASVRWPDGHTVLLGCRECAAEFK
jgi:hypothetical protein